MSCTNWMFAVVDTTRRMREKVSKFSFNFSKMKRENTKQKQMRNNRKQKKNTQEMDILREIIKKIVRQK